MSLSDNFCHNIQLIRKFQGHQQQDFCRTLGFSRQTLSYIENGKQQVTLDMVELFSEALGVDPLTLIAKKLEVKPS
jgi:transcriptional regulator with XRE-family HTH domain